MGSQAIDLSAGLQPAPPPPSSGIDLSAGLQPASAPAATNPLTDNPNREGTYAMKGSKGDTLQVPYSKVGAEARAAGYQLTGGQTWYGAPAGEAARYWKDYAADPKTAADVRDMYKQVQDPGQGVEIGATRSAALTAAGLAHIARKATGTTASTTGAEKSVKEFGEGGDTGAEEAGKFLETAGEFMMGDEALKGLSYVDRLKQVIPALKVLEKSPILARAVDAAIQQGTTGAGQAFVHSGGDPGAAAEAGGGTALLGGVGSATAEGIAGAIARRAPVTETIAGEDVPSLSSQQPGIGPRGDVKPGEVPKFAATQQAAAPRVFRNIAQRATQQALDEANQGRAIAGQITDPARMLPAPADAEPYKFTIPGTATTEGRIGEIAQPAAKRAQAVFKQPSFVTSSAEAPTVAGVEGSTGADIATSTPRQAGQDVATGGGTLTTDAHTAQMHLSRLNELVDHPPTGMKPEQLQAITEARDNLQEQMDMYNAHQRTLPNFAPIDAARTAASVGHFGEAEDQLQQAAQPIYQKIDQATDGEFGKLNRARTAAAKRGDFTAKYEIEGKLDQLITDSGAISPAERQQATKLWATSKVLGAFDDVINNAANVNDRYASQVAGGRTLSGTKLQNGLQGMIKHYGTERLESVIGKDGMENMTRMADLLKTQPQSKIQTMSLNLYHNLVHGKVGAAIGIGIGQHLGGYEGATAGAIAGANAERAVLRYLATNPRAGQLFDYAVRNNVTPKLAAGLISAEIQREHEEPEEDTQQ